MNLKANLIKHKQSIIQNIEDCFEKALIEGDIKHYKDGDYKVINGQLRKIKPQEEKPIKKHLLQKNNLKKLLLLKLLLLKLLLLKHQKNKLKINLKKKLKIKKKNNKNQFLKKLKL